MKNVMKVLWAVVTVAGCAVDSNESESEATQQASAPTVSHFTMNGRGADLSIQDGYSYLNLGVFQNGAETSLWYGAVKYSADFTSFEYEYLWGLIPSGDAELKEREATLRTTGAGLYGEKCFVDFTTSFATCEAYQPSEPILVHWQADRMTSIQGNGTSMYSSGKYSFRTQGNFKATSAQVDGSVLGTAVDGAFGFVSDSRGTSVSKDVVLTP